MDVEKTKVIFKKFKDDQTILAIFPELPGTWRFWEDCMSYAHLGQHGDCSIGCRNLPSATPEEYHNLKLELESIGYNLDIKKRFSQKMHNNRRLNI